MPVCQLGREAMPAAPRLWAGQQPFSPGTVPQASGHAAAPSCWQTAQFHSPCLRPDP